MKTLYKISIAASLAASIMTGVSVLPAHAQEVTSSTEATTDCTITPADLAGIAAAASQGIQAELAARKALLTTVITCAKTDAENLQTKLTGMQVDAGSETLQSQLAGKLGDAMNYYDIELAKVNDAGIAGTEAIARETLSWRQGNYDPLSAQVANFILWSDNQILFTTADTRLQQTEGIVNFLEQAGQNIELQNDLTSAQSLIRGADDENAAAKNALVQFAPADQSLALIQQSLQSLSDAYQKFSDIGAIAEKLLPTQASTQ